MSPANMDRRSNSSENLSDDQGHNQTLSAAKIAQEAVSGWEKAESQVLALRQQVELLTLRNSTLEDRIVHLDGALKDCLRQLRQTREERENLALMLQRELSNQASKQHLDSVKFEGGCGRLNSALQKCDDHGSKTRRVTSFMEKTNRFGMEMDLMDDFLEMERLAEMCEVEERLKKVEMVLKEREKELKVAESQVEASNSRCIALESELETLLLKVEASETEAQKERTLSHTKCRELEEEVSRLRVQVSNAKLANKAQEVRFPRGKRDTELAMARSKFGECQRTISSLNRQLKTLATLDDFLIGHQGMNTMMDD